MEYVNLDKLVWFQEGPGVRNYQYVDKGIKLINVTNLVNGKLKLHLTNRFISEEEANGKYKHFMCDIGDLVIASSGITYDTLDKKIAFVTEKDLPLCMNTSVIRFKPLDNNVCLDFIYYFLKSKKYKNQISKLMTGSAQLNYGPSHLHKVKIPLYSFDKQLKIAKELKKIDSTILICHNNLENLDNIVKSQFIEMFGDVIRNDKKFEECSFKDFVNQMNIGPFGSDLKNNCFVSKKEGYCVVYEQKNAIEKNTNGDFKYISKDKYEKMKRFDVGPGDIIVSCRGTIGKCFVLPNNAPHGIIHSSLMMIKPKKEVNNKFLVFLLENILSEQNELGSGVKMAIKANELAKIKTIRPSKKLQDEFIDIVEQIDKSKFIIQKQIKLLEELLEKKMNEYFGD